MKRMICWLRDHKWRLVYFMGFPFMECSRCGKMGRMASDIKIPSKLKERIRF